ncbi:MAG: UDP-N-acetylglucosamine 2-epimerase (non-hydrolyzing) [Pseudomonadota bacterium]
MKTPVRLICFAGTRPECLKIAPLVRQAIGDSRVSVGVVSSGQHPHMVIETMAHLELPIEHSLAAVPPGSILSKSVAHLRKHTRQWLAVERPDVVLVQGDTSTAYACALAAADCGLPIAHLEAGLRTQNPMRPFPEEPFRRRIAPLARWHFAPTHMAAQKLHDEGVDPRNVHMVGNSIVDLLRETLASPFPHLIPWPALGKRLVVMTLHRRENYQQGLVNVCNAMLELLDADKDLCLVCPVHPNPLIGTRIRRLLGSHPRILLTAPLAYRPFISLLKDASLVVTDSGGIQEEAVYIGVPVLVTRSETERPEATFNGIVRLVGNNQHTLLLSCISSLQAPMPTPCPFDEQAPFGDGHTADRVLDVLQALQKAAAA